MKNQKNKLEQKKNKMADKIKMTVKHESTIVQ
jgi:hypothetical protein